MDVSSVMRLLKKNYPNIYEELTQQPAIKDLGQIDTLLLRFCELKNLERSEVIKNKNQSRMLFITIITKAYDPLFFVDEEKFITYGLRKKLAIVLCCHETQISHCLSTARTYLKVYKGFKEEVSCLYGSMVNSN